MNWIEALPTAAVSAALLLTPGLALGWFLGLRRLWLWALAPAVSITLLSAASVVLPWINVAWTPLSALLFAAVLGALILSLFHFVLHARFEIPHAEAGRSWPTVVAWAFCSIVLVAITVFGIGKPESFSQTIDNIFHLNAIKFIGETGSASPFDIAILTTPVGPHSFYPDAYHALVQLAQQVTGVSIPIAINSFNLAVLASVWPLGMLLFTRQIAGSSRAATLATGIFAASLPAFPLNMLVWGVLYPYFLGLALVPSLLALLLNLLGVSREKRITSIWPQIVLLVGVTFSVAMAHPGAMMGALALSVPIAVAALLNNWRALEKPTKKRRLLSFGTYLVVGLGLVFALRQGSWWEPQLGTFEALERVFTLRLEGYGLPLGTAALLILGIVVAVRAKNSFSWAIVGMWFVAANLYIISISVSAPILRGVTSLWYNDARRLSALFVIAAIPLAVLGFRWLVDTITPRVRRKWIAEAVLIALIAVVALSSADYPRFSSVMRANYTISDHSPLLTKDEAALIKRLPDNVAPDALIAADPWTGTSLAYAFADREIIYPHSLMNNVGKDRKAIMNSLKQADRKPEVCEAVERLNVQYVLDFGSQGLDTDPHSYPGIEGIENSPLFELIDQEGEAKLYRFTGCS